MKRNDRSMRLKSKYIYMKSLNGMNHIHDNEVSNTYEYNLLHDILNPSKRAKNINRHNSPILHACMNTHD